MALHLLRWRANAPSRGAGVRRGWEKVTAGGHLFHSGTDVSFPACRPSRSPVLYREAVSGAVVTTWCLCHLIGVERRARQQSSQMDSRLSILQSQIQGRRNIDLLARQSDWMVRS